MLPTSVPFNSGVFFPGVFQRVLKVIGYITSPAADVQLICYSTGPDDH